MKTKRPELTFDGFGINGPDLYRTRLATFTACFVDKEAMKWGPLFAAAPELLEVCKRWHGYDDAKHREAMPDCADCQVITKAEGK